MPGADWRITQVNPQAARSPKVIAYLQPERGLKWRKA
jgi:hypothetical protein